MAERVHTYRVVLEWTGNDGRGTSDYLSYRRDHLISATSKTPIRGSADGAFHGDPARWNPEELLVSSISACHQLWYLHLCADAGVCVTSYEDHAQGVLTLDVNGGGYFTEVVLRPSVTVTPGSDSALATQLHRDAHTKCFVSNSLNFEVKIVPTVVTRI